MPRLIGRRGFILSLGALGGGVLGAVSVGRGYALAKARLVGRLADWIAESEEARELGKAYLTQYPEEEHVDMLTTALASEIDALPFRVASERLRRLFHARVTQDFAQGRTVKLDNWLFSRTEVRLCALAALRSEERTTRAALGVLEHRRIKLSSVRQPKSEGSDSAAPGTVVFDRGLTVSLDREYHPDQIHLTLDADDTYDVIYIAKGVELSTQVIGPKGQSGRLALYRRRVPVPGQGIDTIRILPRQGSYPYSLGHLHLFE